MDIVLASILLPDVLAASGVIATAIRVIDKMDPYFEQPRNGRDMKPFLIQKFQTMKPGSPQITSLGGNHPQATRLGNFLRKYHLDELPQIFNILAGDMSFVGERAEMTESDEGKSELEITLAQLTEKQQEEYRRARANSRPGLTGSLQIHMHTSKFNEPEELLGARGLSTIEYAQNGTFFGDVRVLAQTARYVVAKAGAELSGPKVDYEYSEYSAQPDIVQLTAPQVALNEAVS